MSKDIPWGKPPRTLTEIVEDVSSITTYATSNTPNWNDATGKDILRDLQKVIARPQKNPKYAVLGIMLFSHFFDMTEEAIRDKLGAPPYLLNFETGEIKNCPIMEDQLDDDQYCVFNSQPITNANIELSIDWDPNKEPDDKGDEE